MNMNHMKALGANTHICRMVVFIMHLCMVSVAFSQEVISTAGADHINGADRITYTIGQPVFTTASSGNDVLTQGFQQSWAVVTSVEDQASGVDVISVYPNPVVQSLSIQMSGTNSGHVMLYGVDGRLVTTGLLTGPLTTVDMEGYSNGEYLLHIIGAQQVPLGTHKIIVNH